MTRPPDPNAKTARIVILPLNEDEELLFRKFKGILAKDELTVREFFLTQIRSKVAADNPQLHFVPVEGGVALNKSPITAPPVSLDASSHQRLCGHCAGYGWVYEE